jgi:tetratricopeptide (TPR) repeat protein
MNTSEPIAALGQVGLARVAPGQLWQVPTFFVGLAAFLAVAASAPIHHPTASRRFDTTLALLRQGLQKNQDPASLVPLAEAALDELHSHGDRAAEVHFLAGSVDFRIAAGSAHGRAREPWRRAVEHFETARQLVPDEQDVPALEYRLGCALYALGRDVPDALDLMTRNIERGTDQPLDGYKLLLEANQKLPTPDLAAALAASRKVVELTDDRDADGVARARLAHARLLLRMERRADAIKELERVGARVSRPLRVEARLLAIENCEQEGMYAKVLTLWQALLADAAEVKGGKGRVLYYIGVGHLQLDQPDYPRAIMAWEEAVKQGDPEAQAAGLRLGALRLAGPKVDPAKGVADWQQALAAVQAPADFRNPYMKLDEVREFFDRALAQFQDAQDYDRMQQVAELYRKVGAAGYADSKIAQAAEAHAKELVSNKAAPADEVRKCLFRAAEAYALAARARSGMEGFDALWHSAQCFLQAHDADRASKVLIELEQIDQEDVRLAEGWYLLAELHRETRHRDESRQAYYRSMQYAATPFAAKSRHRLAMEQVERKYWDKAAEILQPNLEIATQDRETQEQSFYDMAWILIQKQDYARAALYLDQAAARYSNSRKVLLMRAQLAECYRNLATEAEKKAREEMRAFQGPLSDGQKAELDSNLRNYRTVQRERLREAKAVYQAIADELHERSKQRPLTPEDTMLGRRVVLGMAECCQELGEYVEAVRVNQALIEHNRGKIEGLIACHHIVQTMEAATKLDLLTADGKREVIAAARNVLPMAKQDLAAMDPKSAEFQGENVWSWHAWQIWVVLSTGSLAEITHDPRGIVDALRDYQGLLERSRGKAKFDSLVACACIVQLEQRAMRTNVVSPDGQRELVAAARAALTLAQQELTAMDPAGPDFQGKNVWSWQTWQQWLATEQQRMSAAAASGKGPGVQ